ncbi:MAG TPA: serine hydrolase domain-containing protein [Allosphingosinicella sp.]|jgi:CubicO group peptidase (beta-lactamase class C family)
MRTRLAAAISGLCLLIAPQAEARPAASPAPDAAAAAARCVRERARSSGFSGIVSIAQRGKPAALVALGRAAGPDSPAIAERTRFNLASASKMFTAVAVAQLVDGGRVRLDDPIGRFVEGLTPEASAVTVRQLLTHSSGLGNFFAPQNLAAMIRARTASDLLPLLASEKPAFPPGSRVSYSNSGFALLGVLIERVSGQSYGDYLRSRLFAPAGMADTGLDPKPLATLAVGMTAARPGQGPRPGAVRTAEAVAPDSAALHPAPGATQGFGSPAGGLFSTAADMHGFLEALAAHRLASPAMTAAMTAPQVEVAPATADSPARRYGFGFGVGAFEGHRWFGHNGGNLGANVEVAAFPDDGWSIVVLSNRDPPAATDLFRYARGLITSPRPGDCRGA